MGREKERVFLLSSRAVLSTRTVHTPYWANNNVHRLMIPAFLEWLEMNNYRPKFDKLFGASELFDRRKENALEIGDF